MSDLLVPPLSVTDSVRDSVTDSLPASDLLPDPKSAGTIMVGMSGGVDSAVAALLLCEAGFSVQALYMSNWEDEDGYCTDAADFQDARRVCDTLKIPLHRAVFAAEYRERVFAHFLKEYASGRTPNPDVLCNREIKFGVCLDYMRRLGAAWIATGHYARVRRGASGPELLKGADPDKDQSYFLHGVSANALDRTLFPIGTLTKRQVRAMAHAAGLPVFDKPDSTGICFIGERPFREFLGRYLPRKPGPIETPDGVWVGEHEGLALYTLGQRSGLKVGGRAGAHAAPWYVADKDTRRNALIIVQSQDHPLLLSDGFDVEGLHWLHPCGPDDAAPVECAVKTRYRQKDLPCRLQRIGAELWRVSLEHPARAVTPGQYAVFYRDERCLGGGIIARRFNSQAPPEAAPEAAGIAYNLPISAEAS